jgi:hypothetical protein
MRLPPVLLQLPIQLGIAARFLSSSPSSQQQDSSSKPPQQQPQQQQAKEVSPQLLISQLTKKACT